MVQDDQMALVTKCKEQLVGSSGLEGQQRAEKQDAALPCYSHPLPNPTGKLPQVKGLLTASQENHRIVEVGKEP